MNKEFVVLSGLRFDEINGELRYRLQERPFAYEFYHQFRKLWDCGSIPEIVSEDVVIQAEVNKIYQEIPDLKKIPDFLLHKPNTNENIAVIEFKIASNIAQIESDFKKLIEFKQRLKYKYLIEIIIGDENSLGAIIKRIRSQNNLDGKEIILIEFNTDSWKANDYKIKYKRSG